MIVEKISLVSWSNGVLMIGVFAIVSIALIVALILMVNSGSKTTKN